MMHSLHSCFLFLSSALPAPVKRDSSPALRSSYLTAPEYLRYSKWKTKNRMETLLLNNNAPTSYATLFLLSVNINTSLNMRPEL
jgi:hypothetical protein